MRKGEEIQIPDTRLRASILARSNGAVELDELLHGFGLSRSSRDLSKVGQYLAFAGGRSRPYSHRYLLSVLNGTLEPGEPLIRAIRQALAEELDGSVQGAHLLTPQICRMEDCINRFISNHPRRHKCYTCSPVRRKS